MAKRLGLAVATHQALTLRYKRQRSVAGAIYLVRDMRTGQLLHLRHQDRCSRLCTQPVSGQTEHSSMLVVACGLRTWLCPTIRLSSDDETRIAAATWPNAIVLEQPDSL